MRHTDLLVQAMHKSRLVLVTNRTVVCPCQLDRVVSVQRGSQGVPELVVEGVHRCWFQRWEGIDIVGELEKLMERVVVVTKDKNGKKGVVVEEGKSGM